MRRNAKVDANQQEIAQAFRDRGFSVEYTHMVGSGFPDLVIGRGGRTAVVEIKNPEYGCRLTKKEAEFFRDFKGEKYIVSVEEDVIAIDKRWRDEL